MSDKTLLIVGPVPPPIGGSPITVQALVDQLSKNPSFGVALINTSPSIDPREKMTGFNLEKVLRVFAIIWRYIQKVRKCDAVLVFANNLFLITLVPFLLGLSRLFRKPFYIKPVGGSGPVP